jgi:hypothetical protein
MALSDKKNNCPWAAALVPRTIALFIILAQIRLVAGDLADTYYFAAALLVALCAALFLFYRGNKLLVALISMVLIPWLIRFLIVIPRWFAGESTWVFFDSLLLNMDRNNFVSLLPFYWTALTTYFALRSRIFLRIEIIAADVLFLVFFSIVPSASMEAYRWPVLLIALFGTVFFLQILSFILSLPAELLIGKLDKIKAAAAVLVLVILGSLLFLRPSQERAVDRGGGLLEPNLFRFDFSQFLRLDSEISVNNDLILIVKKENAYDHILLRRYTLSGYSPGQGFFRLETQDEKAHPQKLPDRQTQLLDRDEIRSYAPVDQEYYIVNFDPSGFIGMNMPVEITPYETWDSSSFNSVYSVLSHASNAYFYELMSAVRVSPSAETLGLSEEEYALYTDYGGDEEILSYASEITQGYSGYWERIEVILYWLKYGEYRYSLKPGIAPNGDQLKYFLFESKKGYCSYYAFAFTLLLRSLGIPSRVAAGFYTDEDTNVFDYYPVRANMAHAWTEVWFPGYGWIDYDPTTDQLAAGEEFVFSSGVPEQFEGLLKEILDNHSSLKAKEGSDIPESNIAEFSREAIQFLQKRGPWLIIGLAILAFVLYRGGFLLLSRIVKNHRAKARFLWAHSVRRLKLKGITIKSIRLHMSEPEWAANCSVKELYDLYLDYAAARFAPEYTEEDWLKMKENYRRFDAAVRQIKFRSKSAILFVLLVFCFLYSSDAQDTPDFTTLSANELFAEAQRAQEAENWEKAVELYTLGVKLYPDDLNFPWALGNLFYNRRLFNLAWDEYRRCEQISPFNPELLYQLAQTSGYLNMNEVSTDYLQRFLILVPDDREAIGSLAWMYFKIHRTHDGEALLLSAIDRLGADIEFAMTLGTIYSDLFNYEEAKKWYIESIAGAESTGYRLFAAVAHYNLSILESRFYQYNLAFDRTNLSLNAANRSSGRLARGELYLRRMEINPTLAEYQAAFEMDTSPLSKLNLAQVFQVGGRLEEARLYAEDCLKLQDHSWMMNYGIDPIRYYRDVHEILKDTYKGLEKAEAFIPAENLREKILKPFKIIGYRFKAAVHELLFYKYSLLSASSYGSSTNLKEIHLDALEHYYEAFEPYPGRALDYLRLARTIEEPLIPESGADYDFKEGKLRKREQLIRLALENFDPRWEQDLIAEAYAELAKRRTNTQEAEELFAINRGALRQNGITLGVNLEIRGDPAATGTNKALEKLVRQAGIRPLSSATANARYTLILTEASGLIHCELLDQGRRILYTSLPKPVSVAEKALFSRSMGDAIFDGFDR